jgi:hypothetical protein
VLKAENGPHFKCIFPDITNINLMAIKRIIFPNMNIVTLLLSFQPLKMSEFVD